MSQETKSRVVLLSNRGFLAEGLNSVFESSPEFELTGAFRDIERMLVHLASADADIALVAMDPQVTLPTLRDLRRGRLSKIVLWGAVCPAFAFHSMQLGVHGLIPAGATAADFCIAMKAVRAGQLWFTKDMMDTALQMKRVVLTRREGELIDLLAQGLKNKELAYSLGISEGTVKVYLSRLYRKLGVADRFELALYALKNMAAGQPYPLGLRHDNAQERLQADLYNLNSVLQNDDRESPVLLAQETYEPRGIVV
jgi:DNA-binding NarL/FixJ family response regulator